MSEETRVTAFRFKEWALVIMDWTIRRYFPIAKTRTQAVELMVWAWGEAHFTGESLPSVVTALQRLLSKHHTPQMRLNFPIENGFFPRIGGQR